MAKKYAEGRRAWGICQRGGHKVLLRELIADGRYPNLRVDPAWWEPRHPLEFLAKVEDPIALNRPSPEVIFGPTAPVLMASQVATDFTLVVTEIPEANQLDWNAVVPPGDTLLRYDIYRIDAQTLEGLPNFSVPPTFEQLVLRATVDNVTLEAVDVANDLNVQYAYAILAVGVHGMTLTSNIALTPGVS